MSSLSTAIGSLVPTGPGSSPLLSSSFSPEPTGFASQDASFQTTFSGFMNSFAAARQPDSPSDGNAPRNDADAQGADAAGAGEEADASDAAGANPDAISGDAPSESVAANPEPSASALPGGAKAASAQGVRTGTGGNALSPADGATTGSRSAGAVPKGGGTLHAETASALLGLGLAIPARFLAGRAPVAANARLERSEKAEGAALPVSEIPGSNGLDLAAGALLPNASGNASGVHPGGAVVAPPAPLRSGLLAGRMEPLLAAGVNLPGAAHLAFAVRLTEGTSASANAAGPVPLTLPGAAQAAFGSGLSDTLGGNGKEKGADDLPLAAPVALATAPPSKDADAAAAGDGAASSAATPGEEDGSGALPAPPLQNLYVQLTGDNQQRVDIRLLGMAGEMRMSVRAGDTKLAETLQQHLPELAKTLDVQPLRAEIWSAPPAAAAASNRPQSGEQTFSRGGDTPSGGNGGGGQGRQRRQQQNQPDWVAALDGMPGRTITRSI